MIDRLIVSQAVVPETGEVIVKTGSRGVHITETGQRVISRFNLQSPSKNRLLASVMDATNATLALFDQQLQEMGVIAPLYDLQRKKAQYISNMFEEVCDAIDTTGLVPRSFIVPNLVVTGLRYISDVGRATAMFSGLQDGELPTLPARATKRLMKLKKQEAIFIWLDVDPQPSPEDLLCLLVHKTLNVGQYTRTKHREAPLIWQEVNRVFAEIGNIWSGQNHPSLEHMNAAIWKWLEQKQNQGLLVGGILPLNDGSSIYSAGVLPDDTDN